MNPDAPGCLVSALPSISRRALSFASWSGACWLAGACTTDTSALTGSRRGQDVDASAPMASGGGQGGATQFDPLPSGGATMMVPDVVDMEPDLPSAFTIVHGVVDAGRVWLCRASGAGGWDERPVGSLRWGEALRLAEDEASDLVEAGARWLLVTGPSSEPEDSCADLAATALAGPSATRDGGAGSTRSDALAVVELPSIAGGSLAYQRGYTMVLVGCIGAPQHTADVQEAICGAGYGEGRNTLTALLAPSSRRTRYDALGLQLLHASLAAPSVDVRSVPPQGGDGTVVTLGRAVVAGTVSPRSVTPGLGAMSYGQPLDDGMLRLTYADQFDPVFEQSWRIARERGGVRELTNGRTYTVVLLGPHPAIEADAWWHGPTFTVVDNQSDDVDASAP